MCIHIHISHWTHSYPLPQVCPKDKWRDLVFMQAGCMENVLKRYGLCNKKQTQCVPYFWISSIGRAVDGKVKYDTSKTVSQSASHNIIYIRPLPVILFSCLRVPDMHYLCMWAKEVIHTFSFHQDGEPKYAGETVVCGEWRGAVVERLKHVCLSVCLWVQWDDDWWG